VGGVGGWRGIVGNEGLEWHEEGFWILDFGFLSFGLEEGKVPEMWRNCCAGDGLERLRK
jgi:hypothetical protein